MKTRDFLPVVPSGRFNFKVKGGVQSGIMGKEAFWQMDFLKIEDQERWNAFLLEKGGHLLQSYEWGEFKSRLGWRASRVALEEGGKIIAGAQVLVRNLPLGSLAYVPRGPVVDSQESLHELMAQLHLLARQEGSVFLRLEPDWEGGERGRLLEREGFHRATESIQPQSTLAVDIEGDLESILNQMKPKTRYNLRLAERKGVVVREGKEEDLGAFYELLRITGRRDRFFVHSDRYYLEAWRTFVPQGMGRLFLAFYGDQMLAGLMAFAFGHRAYYLYGASSDEHRSLMPNYLVQWEAIRWAKERGCLVYDLWGIPDEVGENGEPSDFAKRKGGLWGVYRFKRGFGGRVVRTVGAFDYVYSPPLYRLLMQVEKVRSTISRL